MIDLPREVMAGDTVRADDFNKVVRALRAIMPLEGPNIMLSQGPNGTVIQSTATGGGRGGGGNVINYDALPSVFEIVADHETCGEVTYRFENQYFEVSGILYDLDSSYTFTQATVANLFLAIVLSSVSNPQASITEYRTFEDLQIDMGDETKSVIPLYKFNALGGVECDLRHIPRADMWNIGSISLNNSGGSR